MSVQVGDYITANGTGHAFYGQIGEVVEAYAHGYKIDYDGDGLADVGGYIPSGGNFSIHSENEFLLNSVTRVIENYADTTLLIVIGIGVIFIGWSYVKRLVTSG